MPTSWSKFFQFDALDVPLSKRGAREVEENSLYKLPHNSNQDCFTAAAGTYFDDDNKCYYEGSVIINNSPRPSLVRASVISNETCDDETISLDNVDERKQSQETRSSLRKRRWVSEVRFSPRNADETTAITRLRNDTEPEMRHEQQQQAYYEIRYFFGQRVYWTSTRHLTASQLEPYRQIGDPIMDDILQLCNDEGIPGSGRFDDLLDLARNAYNKQLEQPTVASPAQRALSHLYQHYYYNIPPWVDYDQIQRGIDVFITYSPVAALALYYRSLVGGFSIPQIVAVLERTGYLCPPTSNETVRERLLDTSGFIASCMSSTQSCFSDGNDRPNEENGDNGIGDKDVNSSFLSAQSLRPGGKGWEMALRVRALHAKVRRSILASSKNKWDVNKYGIPINQEDMAGTLLGFSVNVLWGIEFVAGVELSKQEREDYLALWRYIGWLLGVGTEEEEKEDTYQTHVIHHERDETRVPGFEKQISSSFAYNGNTEQLPPLDPCGGPDPVTRSYAYLESIVLHILHPDDGSGKVARHLLRAGGNKQQSGNGGANSGPEKQEQCQTDMHNGEEASFSYKSRSVLCRRWLGDPLSDALGLYVPPAWSWESIRLSFRATVILMLLRIYTLVTMKVPWVRRKLYRWHANSTNKFYNMWNEGHMKRMTAAANAANRGKKKQRGDPARLSKVDCLEPGEPSPLNNSKSEKGLKDDDVDGNRPATSSCPFALVFSRVDSSRNLVHNGE